METQDLLAVYENVASITNEMVVAARNGNWEQLALLELHCSSQVETLKKFDSGVSLSGEHRDKKVEIIRKILADDQQIRAITEPWMKQLSGLMHSAGTERKLSQAYGPNSGS